MLWIYKGSFDKNVIKNGDHRRLPDVRGAVNKGDRGIVEAKILTLQSLRHAVAMPPPLCEGRFLFAGMHDLWCGG